MDLNACRILVTPRSYGSSDSNLKTELESQVLEVMYNEAGRPLTSDELVEIIPRFEGFIAGLDEIDGIVINAASKLKIIARYGVGVDNVDLEAARESGIVVTNTPGMNASAVAELTIGLMLTLARNIHRAYQKTKQGEWSRMSGVSLEGKTVGILGLGTIGKLVAIRVKAFGCTVLAHDIVPDHAFAEAHDIQFVAFEDVVRQADFLSLHCPLSPETEKLVDSHFIDQMKRGAYLINTARGELIDEMALFEALQEGKLCGVALDVLAQQPPDPVHPLLGLDQVIITPHMGAHTDGAMNAMGWAAFHDCLAVLRGQEPVHRVV